MTAPLDKLNAWFRNATKHLVDRRAELAAGPLAEEYRRRHPGRRLPGGMSSARLIKKRIDRLNAWWEQLRLAEQERT